MVEGLVVKHELGYQIHLYLSFQQLKFVYKDHLLVNYPLIINAN
jgi:hypothetical protein